MPITRFPDPRRTTEEGILALGGDLEPESLLLAYRQGIFPWPVDDEGESVLAWFCPPERAILEFSELHVPARLARTARQKPYEFTVNRDFRAVIEACAESPRPGQAGTWITQEMVEAYCELHRLGYAISVEANSPPHLLVETRVKNDADHFQKAAEHVSAAVPPLVGGIYGVLIDGVFAGESMFYRAPNASKLALLHLIEWLRAQGITWMDIQVMTPHMKALGAKNISRDEFLEKLARSAARARV